MMSRLKMVTQQVNGSRAEAEVESANETRQNEITCENCNIWQSLRYCNTLKLVEISH